MTPVINVSDPGTRRNQQRRTVAEILRQLMLKRELDEEAKDMVAALVFALREIAGTIESSASAWEKRDYFVKADRFRRGWEWALPTAERLEQLGGNERWEQLPRELACLAPHFADIRVTKMTRSTSTWKASYRLLLQRAGSPRDGNSA
jgi:hypothetical protein